MPDTVQQALDEQRSNDVIPRLENETRYYINHALCFLTRALKQDANGNSEDAARSFAWYLSCAEDATRHFPTGVSHPIKDHLNLLSLRVLDSTQYNQPYEPDLHTTLTSVHGESTHILATLLDHIENDHFNVLARQPPV